MDRNTTIGLVLIGLILTVFSIVNQPSKEDLKKKKSAETEQKDTKESSKDKTKVVDRNTGNDTPDIPKTIVKTEVIGEIIRLENDKLIVELNTKGGLVSAVYLKEFKSYKDFAKKKKNPLCLFKDGDNRNQLIFPYKNQTLRSASYVFNILKKSQNSIIFE
ncbi:MAG: hypothetical protein FJZ67_05935, partial [Bacteroidetes bacterium]|nr:hypothetical protein [Bacteroidota bacterium]